MAIVHNGANIEHIIDKVKKFERHVQYEVCEWSQVSNADGTFNVTVWANADNHTISTAEVIRNTKKTTVNTNIGIGNGNMIQGDVTRGRLIYASHGTDPAIYEVSFEVKIGIVKKADGTVIWIDHTAITDADLVDGWAYSETQTYWERKKGSISTSFSIKYHGVTIATDIPYALLTADIYHHGGKTYVRGDSSFDMRKYKVGLLK